VEFIDLLTVLSRLVELEPDQRDLLERVLEGELLTMSALRTTGVRWPTAAADRKPQFAPRQTADLAAPELDLGCERGSFPPADDTPVTEGRRRG